MAYDDTRAQISKGRRSERGQRWLKRGNELFTVKDSFNALFQAQAEIFYPERADFFGDRAFGAERYEGIFTSVPQRMRRDMANNLGAMLRPRGKEWFKAVARPERLMKEPEHKRWLEAATVTQRNIVYAPAANFTRAMAESDQDYVTFGNAIIRHTYNQAGDGLLFVCAHLKDCAWAENHEGKIDEVHERMQMTLRQAAGLFGKDNLPKKWRERLDDHPHEKVKVQRCVAPIEDYEYDKGERPRTTAKFLSIYNACEVDDKEATLGEAFFNWFPYLVRRWMTVSGEPYGRSPCTSVALADARTLNVAQQALLKSVEWKVDPPKWAIHEAVVGEVKLRAGEITYFNGEDLMDGGKAPIGNMETGDPRFGIELVDRLTLDHGRAFFRDLFKLPQKEMTAYEAGKWIEEYVREASPVFEPMEAENAQLMDNVFERSMEKGAFEEAPEGLQGAAVDFEFETPLSSAFRELRAQQAQALVERLTAQAALAPESLDVVNFDAVTRESMEDLPSDWVNTPEQVKAIRDQRLQAQQAQRQEEQAAFLAETAAGANPENMKMLKTEMEGA